MMIWIVNWWRSYRKMVGAALCGFGSRARDGREYSAKESPAPFKQRHYKDNCCAKSTSDRLQLHQHNGLGY